VVAAHNNSATQALVGESPAQLNTGNDPLLLMSLAGTKGSKILAEAFARTHSDSATAAVNCGPETGR
jgi:hypothetical protein